MTPQIQATAERIFAICQDSDKRTVAETERLVRQEIEQFSASAIAEYEREKVRPLVEALNNINYKADLPGWIRDEIDKVIKDHDEATPTEKKLQARIEKLIDGYRQLSETILKYQKHNQELWQEQQRLIAMCNI